VSSTETDRFRVALLSERKRVVAAIENLHDEPRDSMREVSLERQPSDDAGLARQIDSTLEENSEHILAAIDAALELIANGTFGTCRSCGEPIARERLEAMPYATECIGCKRRAERR
jgi:RNA polymerase-binding protein DksA